MFYFSALHALVDSLVVPMHTLSTLLLAFDFLLVRIFLKNSKVALCVDTGQCLALLHVSPSMGQSVTLSDFHLVLLSMVSEGKMDKRMSYMFCKV